MNDQPQAPSGSDLPADIIYLGVKVLTLWQPHASLCVIINPATGEPYKTIETRGWKPPASLIGQRIALHAAAAENWREGQQVGDWLCYRTSKTHQARMYCRTHRPMAVPLPLGAIVATCTLVDMVPIVTSGGVWMRSAQAGSLRIPGGCVAATQPRPDLGPPKLMLWQADDEYGEDIDDQRPYGDFTAGRFAWLLADVVPVDPPEPFKGGQGLTRTWEPHVEAVR